MYLLNSCKMVFFTPYSCNTSFSWSGGLTHSLWGRIWFPQSKMLNYRIEKISVWIRKSYLFWYFGR